MRDFLYSKDVAYGVDANIRNAIDRSIDNNSVETFRVLKTFVRRVMQLSIHKRSLAHFEQYIYFPAYFYSASYSRAKQNPYLNQLHEYCSRQALMHQKEILIYDLGNERRNGSSENLFEVNKFYYLGFRAFSQFLYLIVRNGDINHFVIAMNEFDQVSDIRYDRQYDLESDIRRLESEDTAGASDEKRAELENTLLELQKFDKYRRHTIEGIRCWILYMYKADIVKEDVASSFLDRLTLTHSADIMLQDTMNFRNEHTPFYMGWSEWDVVERPSGKAFFPPDPNDWLSFGFLVDQINRYPLYVNVQKLSSDHLSQVKYLYDVLRDDAVYLQSNFDKWKNVLKVKSAQELQDRCNHVLKVFGELTVIERSASNREIAEAALDPERLLKFKKMVGSAWKRQAQVHSLFKRFRNTELVTGDHEELRQIGFRTFFAKAKMMFVSGPNHQTIYGIDSMGSEAGRREDDEFFSTIQKGDYRSVTGSGLLNALEIAVKELTSNGVNPNIILISPEFRYREQALFDDKRFVLNTNHGIDANGMDEFCLGSFDNILVYTSFSAFLKNKVLVCGFEQAFKMRYKTRSDWYEDELRVDVNLVTDKEARRRLEEDKVKWMSTNEGIPLTEEDALYAVKTSVVIDIWATVDFQVLNHDAYVIGFVRDNNIA